MKLLSYTWDFILGVTLILGVPVALFVGMTRFLMFLLPNPDALSRPLQIVFALAGQMVVFVGPLGVFIKMIGYRKKHRVLPKAALAAEVACSILLFIAAMIMFVYLALLEAVADGIL
jgi:hypothetical protein